MLILRLMGHCNNHCVFCCVREEMTSAHDIGVDQLKARIAQHPPETAIDFFGGEPTLYPHFLDVLDFARQRGHPCTIATNGRRFADPMFCQMVTDLGIQQIRTSLYGHTAELHDYHTSCQGSFLETVKGIRNILERQVELFVNTVVTDSNYQYLRDIVILLRELGVRHVKFSSLLHADHCPELVPDFTKVRPYLRAAAAECEAQNMEFALEKSPLCILPERYAVCTFEPDDSIYRKPDVCSQCALTKVCVGIPRQQLELFGAGMALPFTKSQSAIEEATEQVPIPLLHEFVSWNDTCRRSLTVLLKVAGACNLACDYCYAARNFAHPRMMSQQTIVSLIRQLSTTEFDRVDINWHGGEPLLIKQDVLAEALRLEETLGLTTNRMVVNRIQTNGTLLTEGWVRFFRERQLSVGISLDGPPSVHDAHRKKHDGTGSSGEVQAALRMLKRLHVPATVLVVITASSIGRATDIYRYFQTKRWLLDCVDFLPAFEVDPLSGHMVTCSLDPDGYRDFMITIFDRWFEDDNPQFHIPFLEDIITVLLGGNASLCKFKRGCSGFLTIEPDGSVYPCDRFSGLEDFYLGNLHKEGLRAILASKRYSEMRLGFDKSPATCRTCEWLKLCRGGCAYEAYALSGRIDEPTYYCDALKQIYEHIELSFIAAVKDYRRFASPNIQ